MTESEKIGVLIAQAYFSSIESLADQLVANGVVVREKGEWEDSDDGDGIVCSVCREDFCVLVYETERFNFCPNCGADMRKGENDG